MRLQTRTTRRTIAVVLTLSALGGTRASAQVDCWAPREQQDSVATAKFAPIRQTLLAIENIIRGNTAYLTPPEPVRMRTTIAAGPAETGGARIFVRAYPEKQGQIQVWTRNRCDVIPQAERVAASVGQVYVFVNYNVREQFLGGDEVPKYEGEVAGFPVYSEAELNAPAVWTDRSGEGQKRLDATIAEFQQLTPEERQQADALGRESRELERQARAAAGTDPQSAAALRERSNALALEVREIRNKHVAQAFFRIQDARAEYELLNLEPGTPDQAMAFKPDPAFPDFRDPFRPQLIMLNFWSKSDPKDSSPRSVWLRRAKETFDFAALAALLR